MKENKDFFDSLLSFLEKEDERKVGRPSTKSWRKTKLEAFFDLWNKTRKSYTSPVVRSMKTHTLNNIKNQCVVSLSDLAKEWGWNRETIRNFLKGLERNKAIRQDKFHQCELITWLVEIQRREVCENHFHNIILSYVHNVMDKWLVDGIDNRRAGQLIAEYWSAEKFEEYLKTENTLISAERSTPQKSNEAEELRSKIIDIIVTTACEKTLLKLSRRLGSNLAQNDDDLLRAIKNKKIGWEEFLEDMLLIPLLPLDVEYDILLPMDREVSERKVRPYRVAFRNRLVSLLTNETLKNE